LETPVSRIHGQIPNLWTQNSDENRIEYKKALPFQKHPLPKVTDGSGDVGGAAVDSMQAGNGGSARGCGAGGSV